MDISIVFLWLYSENRVTFLCSKFLPLHGLPLQPIVHRIDVMTEIFAGCLHLHTLHPMRAHWLAIMALLAEFFSLI